MQELIDALKECGALRFGEFTLASGAVSDYYVDIKLASSDPVVLTLMSRLMAERLQGEGLEPEAIAGVVLGSIPLATALSLETGLPLLMVRKERKGHGTGRLVEGPLSAGTEVLVVEDVVTSAGSALDALATLREEGAVVDTLLAVIDRESGGREALQAQGVRLISLLQASQLRG